MPGIIALDIDGTLTAEMHSLEQSVVHLLNQLYDQGWKFIFITGRPFHWSAAPLRPLTFPYVLAVQNGALLLEMPTQKILERNYLKQELIPQLHPLCQQEQTDFIIYTGFENQDICYYRPENFSPSLLSYMQNRTQAIGETWVPLETFFQLPVPHFPSIKFFAEKEQASRISLWLEQEMALHAPPNRDPYNPEIYVVQGTHAKATKGDALQNFIGLSKISGPIIAAGDDYNDQSMLQKAHVKVVMSNAPPFLLKSADVIAPPASQNGIIQGLLEAVKIIGNKV